MLNENQEEKELKVQSQAEKLEAVEITDSSRNWRMRRRPPVNNKLHYRLDNEEQTLSWYLEAAVCAPKQDLRDQTEIEDFSHFNNVETFFEQDLEKLNQERG